jgi:hypothetical protein
MRSAEGNLGNYPWPLALDVERAFHPCNISTKETNDRGDSSHEGDRGDGPGLFPDLRNRSIFGIKARDRLADHIGNRPIDCVPNGADAYDRTLAICTIGGESLNAWMVQQGWALAFVRYSKEYVPDEEAARAAGRGLWSGAFIAPWDWRHRNRQTVVLGATSVPVSAQTELLAPASAAAAPSPQCIIKGNVNRKGERIYFRPGQLDYARVDMSKPGKRWFCTEQDAQTAGWRPAAR